MVKFRKLNLRCLWRILIISNTIQRFINKTASYTLQHHFLLRVHHFLLRVHHLLRRVHHLLRSVHHLLRRVHHFLSSSSVEFVEFVVNFLYVLTRSLIV